MKLIALRPLKGCNPKYLKLLSTEEIYLMCNNYEIDKEDKITKKASLPHGFFSSKKPQINVQAIVGKNGSGKSTLIELLFRAINNIAFHFQKIKIADISEIEDLRVEFYYETDTFYKVQITDKIHFFRYDGRSKKINIPIDHKLIDLKNLFYTIVVNYSHYAYNVSNMDEDWWIDGLFHKNDGYRTPIVLNPFRINGNIDINSENHLVKSRLITNLLLPVVDNHFRQITKHLYASDLILSVNKSVKQQKILYTKPKDKNDQKVTMEELNLNREDLLTRLDLYFKFGYRTLDKKIYKVAIDYLVYKLVSIALKYYNHEDDYFYKEEDQFNESKLNKFFEEIFKDTSHITLKLRQTINFLKFKHIDFKKQTLSLDHLSKINNNILIKSRKQIQSIELVPPPIFKTEIILTPINEKAKRVPFRMLSSGEKQMVYSVSSILYHILNLESVSSNTKRRTAYRHINVILEEIEMYAHPEMQRRYIKYMIESIERLALRRTLSINLCFVTHSPFILSDIPEINILFLNETGTPEPLSPTLKTFGGNIHDLLAHSFFLEEGAIGAFALDKINRIIENLTDGAKADYIEEEVSDILMHVQLIAEPFLRNKLLDMFYTKFDKRKRIDELEAELKKLKAND